jgi:polysaccharide deacetylase family protein (PEP-CTERM system associated)
MNILLTIDVEDWFQVENLRPWIPFRTWDFRELRVERNTHALLDLFDDVRLEDGTRKCEAKPGERLGSDSASPPTAADPGASLRSLLRPSGGNKVRCTFFTLGWIAERLPGLVREIAARGHEVACHGYSHRMCNGLSEAELRKDLRDSKRLLEDLTGDRVAGFRAPNFSIDKRVLTAVRDSGYRYDSSYNSFSLHGRYGRIDLNGGPKAGIAYRLGDDFFELPVSNLPVFHRSLGLGKHPMGQFHLPWSGGAYFRLMPLWIFIRGIRSILHDGGAYAFYLHPWEVDPSQPKMDQASFRSRFKHYTNLWKTKDKLKRMIELLGDCRFMGCREYLEDKTGYRQG